MNKGYQINIKNIIDERALSELEKLKVKCQCGHTIVMPVYCDKMICKHCGRKVNNNSMLYFKYKLQKARRELEK